MITKGLTVLAGAGLLGVAACHKNQTTTSSQPEIGAAEAQIDQGAEVFANNCAKCHGEQGRGGTTPGGMQAPPLVGENALPLRRQDARLRTGTFATAQDVAQFAMHNMPPSEDARARLSRSEYWAVVAFALDANGIRLTDPLGPQNADRIDIN